MGGAGVSRLISTRSLLLCTGVGLDDARPVGGDANLRSEAVEAMNVLIKNSAKDMTVVVRSTLEVVLSHLEQSFGAQILTAEDRDRVQGLQSLLCGNLQVRRDGESMVHGHLKVRLLATRCSRRVAAYPNLEVDEKKITFCCAIW